MDKYLSKLYDQYGPDIRPVKWLTPQVELDKPRGMTDSGERIALGELLPADPAAYQPEDQHIQQFERAAKYRLLSQLLQELPHCEALAVALVYDLDVTGHPLDTATIAAGVGKPVTELQTYVDTHILPKLKQLDAKRER